MLFAGKPHQASVLRRDESREKGYRVVGTLENTDRIMSDTFWVGVYPGMTDEKDRLYGKVIKEGLLQ